MPFVGKVIRVEPSQSAGVNPLILVDHYPLVSLTKKDNLIGLPVEVSLCYNTDFKFYLYRIQLLCEILYIKMIKSHHY